MKLTRDKLSKFYKRIPGRVVLALAFTLAFFAIATKAFSLKNPFQPDDVSTTGKIQQNHVIFPAEEDKTKDKVSGDSDLWEKNKDSEDQLDKQNIPNSTTLFEKEVTQKQNQFQDYVDSDDGEKQYVNLHSGKSNSQGTIKVPVSGNGQGNGASTDSSGESGGSAGNGDGSDGAGTGTGSGNEAGNGNATNTGTSGSNAGNKNPASTPKPPNNTSNKGDKEDNKKLVPPEPDTTVPKGDSLIESVYPVKAFPAEGVDEADGILSCRIIPIFDADFQSNIYYNANITAEKLLNSVLVYLVDENNIYRYRISSFSDNFKVGEFPSVATEDFTVTFSFRQSAASQWQTVDYTYEVAPYKFFVLDYENTLIGNVTPDVNTNAKANEFSLHPYYYEMLSDEQKAACDREDGLVLDSYIPGWKDEKDNKIYSDLYVANEKGWKAFYPLNKKTVPSGYEIRMKWFVNEENFNGYGSVNYLQTLTKIPDDLYYVTVPQGVQRVYLKDTELTSIELAKSTVDVYTDGLSVTDSYVVPEENPYFASENGLLWNKEKTELVGVPTKTRELTISDLVKTIHIPKVNHIHAITFEGNTPPDIDLENLTDTVLWVPADGYDEYLASWGKKLPDSVSLLSTNADHVIKNNAILSKDGKILYRIIGDVIGNYVVPDSVEVIKKDAMANASQISLVVLPDSVKEIESDALTGRALEEVVMLGETAPKISGDSITKLDKMQIYIRQTAKEEYADDWDSWNLKPTDLELYQKNGYAYLSMNEDRILLSVPKNLEEFRTNTLPDGITETAPGAFSQAKDLMLVELPDTVQKIDKYSFAYCDGLQVIIVHQKNKITIENKAYDHMPNLRLVCYEANEADFKDGYAPHKEYSDVEAIYFTGSSGYVSQDASYEPEKASSENLPVGNNYFYAEGTKEKGYYIYAKYGSDEDQHTVVAGATDNIAGELQMDTETSQIMDGAFRRCRKLTRADFSKYPKLHEINPRAFMESGLQGTLVLTDNIEAVGRSAFAYCGYLDEIEIKDGMEKVADRVFEGCSRVKKVTFTDTSKITSVDTLAFSCCDSLENVTLPATLTSLATNVFSYCTGLQVIRFLSETPPELATAEETSFQFGVGISEIVIRVPKGKRQDYLDAWKSHFENSKEGISGEELLEKLIIE